jgi:hypothetical protein
MENNLLASEKLADLMEERKKKNLPYVDPLRM